MILMMTATSGPIASVPVADPVVEPAAIVTVNSSEVPAGDARRHWLAPGALNEVPHLDLVDGSSVRQDPLPALFSFIDKECAGMPPSEKASSALRSMQRRRTIITACWKHASLFE